MRKDGRKDFALTGLIKDVNTIEDHVRNEGVLWILESKWTFIRRFGKIKLKEVQRISTYT